ncbi:DNA methyltransferase [Tenacibaculum jejuense]|uniref:site-specific DNA-methyltransferase (adenine-specific) n=1 Tax=Tenacibaculum jejuense TaxID=584609 RepID=A0A238U523_9FLAO|nr:site-specific DNA-methyltransferase [Tenacibaculum jejuense]SNR14192.1 Site-specific DNA-methyltransferase [Tenacibaculum jejuense]
MPIKYIPYTPNTIEGQAVLDNITRTKRVLRYRENNEVYNRLERGMPYYEVETVEQVGESSDNLIMRGECVSNCAYLKEQGIKVDLVYIDPPFASGVDYAKKVYLRRNPKLAEKIKTAKKELNSEDFKFFEEKMYGDIWQKEEYLNWMYENLQAIRSIMNENASIYLHLDTHIGHYGKILMDEVFGEDNFINHISWMRSHAHGDSGQGSSHFGRVVDMIFYYRLGSEGVWNPQYLDYSEETIKRDYKYKEKDGRKYRLAPVDGPGGASKGNPYYEFEGISGYWRFSKEKMQKLYDEGIVVKSSTGKSLSQKKYLDEAKGKSVTDLWDDVYRVSPTSNERVDYATQKPEALLTRIIETSSNEKMIVADFFGGSGVTAKVANKLGRKFIHCDVGINSIQTVRDRLVAEKANFTIKEVKDGVNLFRNPQQTMDKLATLITGLQTKVEGVSNFWLGAINDSKLGTVPVYVPDLIDSQQKLLDIPTINRIINQEIQNLSINAKKVIVYYIDIDDEKELKKFIKENNATTTDVELKDLKNLLHETVVDDELEFSITEGKGEYTVSIDKFTSDRLQQKINEFNEKGNLQAINKGKKFDPINISEEGLELIELISLDCKNSEGEWFSSTEIKIDKLGYVIYDGEKSKDFWNGKITSKEKSLRIKVRNISGDESIVSVE